MPFSSADSFIFLRVIFICRSEAATLMITVDRMISRDGTTRAGAKRKI